jgi:hypothetical protein
VSRSILGRYPSRVTLQANAPQRVPRVPAWRPLTDD